MRILTVSNLYPPDVIGGYELACHQMTRELRARGHDVHVLTTWPRLPLRDEPGVERSLRLVDWYMRPHDAVPSDVTRLIDLRANVIDAANVGVLLRAISQVEPDVVYLWNLNFLGAYGLAGALAHLQVPVVWHLMDAVPRSAVTVGGQVSSSAGRLLSRRLRALYLACSQRLVDEIEHGGFRFGEAVRVVPNWVDPFPQDRERDTWPVAAPRLRLVSAGQLAPHKGLDLVLEMAGRLLAAGRTAFSVDLYGNGMLDHYRRMILDHELADHVRLMGAIPQDELVERLWDYDVFLFPTWSREPFAFAPLEAAARRCVSIMSRDCGNAEWGVDGVDVLKIDRGAGALAAAVGGILDRKVDLSRLGQGARRAVENSFTIDRVADSVEEALTDARALRAARPGRPEETYHLARLTEALAFDWADQNR